jgi:hypothetical protein
MVGGSKGSERAGSPLAISSDVRLHTSCPGPTASVTRCIFSYGELPRIPLLGIWVNNASSGARRFPDWHHTFWT